MFIRPVGVTVSAAIRPAGRPLLRGLLARAATGTAPGHGDAGRSRSADRPVGAYPDPYADEPPYPDDADEPARQGYPAQPPYPEQAGAYAEEPPYAEPDDADEPDWPEPAEPGAEPAAEPAEPGAEPGGVARAAGPGSEPGAGTGPGGGAGTRAADRAAEPYAGLPAELAQLAGLAREGLLTPEEFAAAKALLLHP
ncbi:hypothetical protein ACFWAP_03585 [Streptomyces goshikiensis]|uniref:hypothetical protein n=1 Tax=Streptomyces goshikiensis TaxID=1942 RepID=UPI003651369E